MTIVILTRTGTLTTSKVGMASLAFTAISLARVLGFEGAALGRNWCMRCCCCCCCDAEQKCE